MRAEGKLDWNSLPFYEKMINITFLQKRREFVQQSFVRKEIRNGLNGLKSKRLWLALAVAVAAVGGGAAYRAGMRGLDVAPSTVNAELTGMIAAQSDEQGRAIPVQVADKPLEPMDLNKATLEQLDALPGIGPAKAQAILETRRARRGFKRIDELLDVPGIGVKTLDKLKPYLIIEPAG
jgi:competence ComEA-like helix-hairpin-helix protein